MRILMVSSETAPLATTGELGDAVGSLARALASRGHDVVTVLPEYGTGPHPESESASLGPLGAFPTASGPRLVSATVSFDAVAGARVVQLRCPPLFGRSGLYGDPEDYDDNPDRFWVLSIGALAVARRLQWTPEIIHGHDWHAGWLPAASRSQPDFQDIPTVHTCYDLRMSGPASMAWARELGVVPELLKPEGIEFFGQVSFAKVGLRFADVVVMSAPEGQDVNEGLGGVVRARGAAVTRIPRTIDVSTHDPSRDLGLPARYSADALGGKAICKRRLQAAMGLAVNPHAVLVLVGREPAGDRWPARGHDPQIQWLPIGGLADGLRRLAFAGADAVLEASGDPWSALCRAAERYGVAVIIPGGGDGIDDAYTFAADDPKGLEGALTRLVADFSEPARWQEALRHRLLQDPENGVARHETLYRQVRGEPAGPPVPWAAQGLIDQLRAIGT